MDSLFDSFMVGSQLSLACSQRSLRLPDTVDEDKVEASFGSEIVSFRSNVISHRSHSIGTLAQCSSARRATQCSAAQAKFSRASWPGRPNLPRQLNLRRSR
jgi:hypothetical protein